MCDREKNGYHVIESHQAGRHLIDIIDDDAGSVECPLDWEDSDSLIFASFEKRSVLSQYNPFTSTNEVPGYAKKHGMTVISLFRYEHGLVMYAAGERNPFACNFDSGCVGWILIKEEDFLKPANEVAEGICQTITDWCNGSIYGMITYEKGEDGSWVDCQEDVWGYIGIDGISTEAESSVQTYDAKDRAVALQNWFAFGTPAGIPFGPHKPFCTECGSDSVVVDSTSEWDAEKEIFVHCSDFDHWWCGNCNADGKRLVEFMYQYQAELIKEKWEHGNEH